LTATLVELTQALEDKTPEAIVELAVEGWYSTFIREIYPNWHEREEDLVSLIGFAARFDTLEELLAQLVLLSSELSNRSEQDSKRCLRLTTVHQAKGLEFPIVFIIGLADGLFPLKRTIDEGDLEEARRLFYVAATRAQEELYLCYPMLNSLGNNIMRMNPSRFVQEIDPSLFQTLKISPNHHNRRW
jgi:DNA helicase-2/ATP-dependent DNA helicase PcrA